MVCVEFRREGEKIAKMREGDKRKGGRRLGGGKVEESMRVIVR